MVPARSLITYLAVRVAALVTACHREPAAPVVAPRGPL